MLEAVDGAGAVDGPAPGVVDGVPAAVAGTEEDGEALSFDAACFSFSLRTVLIFFRWLLQNEERDSRASQT